MAKKRKLRTRWSIEPAQKLMSYFGLTDVEYVAYATSMKNDLIEYLLKHGFTYGCSQTFDTFWYTKCWKNCHIYVWLHEDDFDVAFPDHSLSIQKGNYLEWKECLRMVNDLAIPQKTKKEKK